MLGGGLGLGEREREPRRDSEIERESGERGGTERGGGGEGRERT